MKLRKLLIFLTIFHFQLPYLLPAQESKEPELSKDANTSFEALVHATVSDYSHLTNAFHFLKGKKLIDQSFSEFLKDTYQYTLPEDPIFIYITQNKNFSIAYEWLREWRKAQGLGYNGSTPLHRAILFKNTTMVSLLIHANIDIHSQDDRDNRPLHYAATYAMPYNIIQELLDASANIDAQDKFHHDTPLHIAAMYGDTQTVLQLLIASAKIDKANKQQVAPLGRVVRKTAEHNALYDYSNWRAQISPQHIARKNPLQTMYLLLVLQADINKQDELGNTILHNSIMFKDLNLIKFLINKGASLNIANKEGKTPLQQAHERKIPNSCLEKDVDIH